MLERHMRELQKEMKLDRPFPTDTPGTYTIPLDTDLAIFITAGQPEGYIFTSQVAVCPEENQEQFFTDLMIANLFGQGTYGAILGLDGESNKITLQQEIEQDLDYQEFSDILEDFMNTAEFWRDEAKKQKETQT